MTSERALFAGVYARGAVAAELTDGAWLQALLDVEAALARAAAAEREISSEAAAAITAACVASRFDADALGRDGARHASPVVPLVAALRQEVGEPHARDVHAGATSQDILDTALMLIARRALAPLLADAHGAADAAATLADRHRASAMIGRTLLQQAAPVTFGLRAAGWMSGLDAATERLAQVGRSGLPVQMGGPVGRRAPAIGARVAVELDLIEPTLPWTAIRVAPAELASGLGVLAGVLGKIARDVTLLAQQEVGEASEPSDADRGRSSAMPHKHNPVAAVSVLACVKRVPGLVATVLACMEQEHERAAGAWQAEWGTHSELLGLVGSATAWGRELLEQLQVDAPRMLANLETSALHEADAPGGADELIDRALTHRRRRSR